MPNRKKKIKKIVLDIKYGGCDLKTSCKILACTIFSPRLSHLQYIVSFMNPSRTSQLSVRLTVLLRNIFDFSEKASYGTMVFVRCAIVEDMTAFLKKAVTIAVRYSAVRRQVNTEIHFSFTNMYLFYMYISRGHNYYLFELAICKSVNNLL